jgi:hypothetical protein
MTKRRTLRRLFLLAGAAIGASAVTASGATSVKPYVAPVGTDYQVAALLSAGDQVPLTSDATKQYRMVGIPDGLGAHRNQGGGATVYMNHELGSSAQSEPFVGGAKYRGALVSKWIVDAHGNAVSGQRAYDTVYAENTLVGPAAEVGNTTPAFARFCSAFLAGSKQGFDRWIYLTNEESEGTDTFDAKGGLSVAIFDGELHTLPKLGRYSKENTVVQPGSGAKTVIFSMEDGPATLDSQLWMYLGTKDRSAHASVLARNGLDNGTLYVFRSLHADKNSERTFTTGSITGEWVAIPGAESLTAAQLEAAADAAGAMTFIRPEDAAFNPNNRNELIFDTTGSSTGVDDGVNELGRLYSLQLHPGNVLEEATLRLLYNADATVAAGGDIAVSPDNVDASKGYLMINEDGTTESRAVMAAKRRDGSIWRFAMGKAGVDVSSAKRIAELDPPGRDGAAVNPGVWETSGIIDVSAIFGHDTWLADVQAHSPTAAPGGSTVTVEDGQLFLLSPR